MALRPTSPPPPAPPNSALAQRDAAQKDGFVREVDEELRKQEALALAKRYGVLGAVVLALGLAALAGWLGYTEWEKRRAGERAEKLVLALDKLEAGDPAAASAALAPLAAEGSAASKASAALGRAAILEGQGKRAEAAKAFAAVAADGGAPEPYRNLALLRGVAADFDALAPQTAIDRLRPLAVPGGAFFGSAGELTAIAQLKLGKEREAGALLGAVARDEKVPQTLRQRAAQLAAQLGVDATDQFIKAKGGTAAAPRP